MLTATLVSALACAASAVAPVGPTVMIPATALEGEYITVKNDHLGKEIRMQVPQGGTADGAQSIPIELKREYIVPEDTSQDSLQVHLHHLDRSSHSLGNSIAISWATPGTSKCAPTVTLGSGSTITGVTRTYPAAEGLVFHHVQLGEGTEHGEIQDGARVDYMVSCNGTAFSSSFAAPRQTAAAPDAYSFAVFGDMGISTAAQDTVASISASLGSSYPPGLDAVYHIGDLSYARGQDSVWNQFFGMIEEVASKVPWSVAPGNHDMRNGDSSGECGLPMLARFETPSSQQAFHSLAKKNDSARCKDSFDFSEGNPYWWAASVGHSRIITYSTDSNLTAGSPQRLWLERELKAANAPGKRAEHPWLLLMGHKPMYTASTFPGCIDSRGEGEQAGGQNEGTEGALTAELEELFVDSKVDVSFYGHIHSYNRMFPVKANGTQVERGPAEQRRVYHKPSAPVHMMIGMAGAGHLGTPYEQPLWSAHDEVAYGWVKATFANSSALHLEFVANGDGSQQQGGGVRTAPTVHDDVWITK